MNVLDLFSGIGGFSLGLERAGMRTVAFCEIDPYARAVLAKHWPDVPCYDDIRTLTADRLAADGIAVDIICGGFPCQDVSVANVSGEGLAGERSGLWFEYERLIGELRPKYAVVENVANLFNRGIERVLGGLAALGYDAEWRVIRACDVGAPHQRERAFIVAYPERQRLQGCVEGPRIFSPETATYAKSGDGAFGAWGDLDAAIRSVPHVHGLSVGMVRQRLKPYGNAIVPQIAEIIGRAILDD